MDFLDGKPLLQYPCDWVYQVIGADEAAIRDFVADLVGSADYDLSYSKASRTGKYCSLRLKLTVHSEADRDRIFVALQEHPSIRAVI